VLIIKIYLLNSNEQRHAGRSCSLVDLLANKQVPSPHMAAQVSQLEINKNEHMNYYGV